MECCQTRDNKRTVPFLVVGNKVDRLNDRKIRADDVEQWCRNNGDIPHLEVSAKDGTRVTDLFEKAARLGYRNKTEHTIMPLTADSMKLEQKVVKKKGCC
eukprot:TRINITY_DN2112_c0_g1_i6.p2 TRINITY_DN2112_c0_g1~~TRINITY_DN2112_c0_g1_i6.p2  ORF type:complete len:100 (-),score=22.18 TRINITY_DN2112_c0_g1_i6:117-416(-)